MNSARPCALAYVSRFAAPEGANADAMDLLSAAAYTGGSVLWLWQVMVREYEVRRCRFTPDFRSRPHACFQLLKLKHDKLLPNFASKCNLRHYNEGEVDRWRVEEAKYEEKSDPPQWSWTRLTGSLMHQPVVSTVILFLCGGALSDVISLGGAAQPCRLTLL